MLDFDRLPKHVVEGLILNCYFERNQKCQFGWPLGTPVADSVIELPFTQSFVILNQKAYQAALSVIGLWHKNCVLSVWNVVHYLAQSPGYT